MISKEELISGKITYFEWALINLKHEKSHEKPSIYHKKKTKYLYEHFNYAIHKYKLKFSIKSQIIEFG